MVEERKIDVQFHAAGQCLKVDHGYALFSAISGILPFFHHTDDVLVSPVRGRYIGNGLLNIAPSSRLVLRMPVGRVVEYINLAGKILDIDGHVIRIGVPNSYALIPSTTLYAHLVTTRNGQDQQRFEQEITRQFEMLGCSGRISVGKRRTFRVHGRQVVGYSMLVSELSSEDSITIQESGLGGRSKMGCGFFVPWRGK